MRAVNAPAESVAFGSGKQFILLRIIEILHIQPALLFAERRLRQRAFAIGVERPEIMFQARHQRHMAAAIGPGQAVQQVAHHRPVDANILRLRILARPCADNNGVWMDIGEGRSGGVCILQIGRHRQNALLSGGMARQAMDRPSRIHQQSCCRTAIDTAYACDQDRLAHDCLRQNVFNSKLVMVSQRF